MTTDEMQITNDWVKYRVKYWSNNIRGKLVKMSVVKTSILSGTW